MPLFVCLSGYLYQSKTHEDRYTKFSLFIKNKFLRLIVPYLFWGLLQLLIFPATTNLSMMYTGVLHLWFLLMMFILFVIMWPLRRWTSNAPFLIVLLILTIIIDPLIKWTNILCIGAVAHFFPFFLIGMLLPKLKKRNISLILNTITLIFGTIILAMTTYYYNPTPSYIIRISESICICLILLSLFKTIDSIPSSNQLASTIIVQSINKNSYGIYILHHIVIWGAVQIPILKTIMDSNIYVPPVFLFFTSFALSWFVSSTLRKNKYTKIVLGEIKR